MSSGADGGSAVWREREKKIKRRNEATAARRGGPRPAAGPPAPAQVGRGGTRLPCARGRVLSLAARPPGVV